MKPKNFSEKWDREEDLHSRSSVLVGKRSWKRYIKWIIIGVAILIASLLLQRFL